MKKLNKKGFTLIELLAVIVVLAVIMVIATQQVNRTIKKSRGNSFYETVQSVRKAAQLTCAEDNALTIAALKNNLDAKEITVAIGTSNKVTVTANAGGKFTNVIFPKISTSTYTAGTSMSEGDTVATPSISFIADCGATAGTQKFE